MVQKKVISKAIAKSSNKNHLEETPTTEIKKKLTARKEEVGICLCYYFAV